MNRRTFLLAGVAAGTSLLLRRSAVAEVTANPTPPASAAEQSALIRVAATTLLQSLRPDQRDRMVFPFPKGKSPTAVGFGSMMRRGGPVSGQVSGKHDVAFDADGHVEQASESADQHAGGPPGGWLGGGFGNHGPDNGPHGGPRDEQHDGPHGGPHGGPPAAGEKFGDAVWTNFPVDIVARPGVQMGDLTADERASAYALIRTVLSPMGYQKVLDIMAADQVVADAGADYAAGFNVYTMGLFGQPSADAPWMLQFGGHHLGLNVVFAGDRAVCAPLHTGILPARFEANGKVIRGLGRENDKAFDLIATLSPDQLKATMIDHDVSELIRGPGRPNADLPLQGLRGSDMNASQQATLLSLIGEWVNLLNDAHASTRLDDIRKSLLSTSFAWSGPTTHASGHNGEAYFLIHGPGLLIEHAPQRNQGGYRSHVHTVMRDLQNDYGKLLV